MEPLLILVLLPLCIGIVSEILFRDTTRASFAAAAGTTLGVFLCLRFLDSEGGWNWLAALLVSPLAITFAVAAVLIVYGRSQVRRKRNGQDA